MINDDEDRNADKADPDAERQRQREYAAKLQAVRVASTNLGRAVSAVLQHRSEGATCFVSPGLGLGEIRAAEKLLVEHKKSLMSAYVQLRNARLKAGIDLYDVPAVLQDIESEAASILFCLSVLSRLARREDFIAADDVALAALTGLDEAELHDYLDRLGTRFRLLCEQIWDLDDHADLTDMEDHLGRIG